MKRTSWVILLVPIIIVGMLLASCGKEEEKPPLYGIATYYSKDYDGITMGFQQVMWSFGGSYGDPNTYKVDGYINSEDSLKALEYYKELYKFSPPGSAEYYWAECLDAFKKGLVAMAMDYFAFLPGLLDPAQNPYADKIGFFTAPAGPKGHFISIGGQGMSVCAYSKKQDTAKQYIKWFIQKPIQEKWAKLGGFTPHKEVLQSDTFMNATPYNRAFADSFPYLRDFWAMPEYAKLLEVCQTNWNGVVVGQMEPKAAMDGIAKRHEEIFKEAGYYSGQVAEIRAAKGTPGTGQKITIAWAEWPPADYLAELSKDFTTETGIEVEVVQIPWPNFQDKIFISLQVKSDKYDIIIGDSQWLGVGATDGHYVELTDWIRDNIDVSTIYGPAMVAFAEYPKGSERYWAVPAEVDANGYAYRKDLFEDPKEKEAFKKKYGYELDVPKTYKELRDIAEFFTRP